jgi:DNA polymerase I-like protein with 3'-5' exonuclease and polymerase domains
MRSFPSELRGHYLDRPEQWAALAGVIRGAGIIGLDSEYAGVAKNESCVGRARIHVWSVAVRTGELDPRGYVRCRGWALSSAALESPELKAVLEDPGVTKYLHNQGVDIHAFANHGVRIAGAVNTLGYVRWQFPHLINEPGRFRLKGLMSTLLGREPVCTFAEVVADERTVRVIKERTRVIKGCQCGAEGCRKRQGEHRKVARTETYEVVREKTEKFNWELADIVPGHPRWNRLVRYAIEDSVAALQVAELCDRAQDPRPFPFGDRPRFSQGIEDAFTSMEAVGFHRDLEFCTTQAALADELEEKELEWLYRWYVLNAPWHGPFIRGNSCESRSKAAQAAGVDATWSSPQKLLRLFDTLGFPRSPIWKKGRVKKGDVKLDEVALEWIARAEKGATKLVKHLLRLKRIRSGRKYLVKLRDAGDVVHIITGPSGDDDERAGAVTGRAAIKGPLEAQQLPAREDKDLFHVRKAIVAPPGEMLLVADYSALEIGVMADLCARLLGDNQLVEAYKDQAKDIDIHSVNAREVFGRWLKWTVPAGLQYAGLPVDVIPVAEFKKHPHGKVLRNMAKAIWFGLAFGKEAYGFSTLAGADGDMIGEKLAHQMVEAMLDAVPGLRKWFAWVEDFVRKNHGIYSLGGRWCDLSREMETDDEWQHKRAFRRARNFPTQSSGADIVGDAMVRINRCPIMLSTGYRLILNVHDELVMRGPVENLDDARELLVEHMTSATANGVKLLLPLQVATGHGGNYHEAK